MSALFCFPSLIQGTGNGYPNAAAAGEPSEKYFYTIIKPLHVAGYGDQKRKLRLVKKSHYRTG
jgi:hypothetical protein